MRRTGAKPGAVNGAIPVVSYMADDVSGANGKAVLSFS